MHKIRKPIIYRTPCGKDIVEMEYDEYYVLNGFDGERYLLCYRCNYFGYKLNEKFHVIKPICEKGYTIPHDFEFEN